MHYIEGRLLPSFRIPLANRGFQEEDLGNPGTIKTDLENKAAKPGITTDSHKNPSEEPPEQKVKEQLLFYTSKRWRSQKGKKGEQALQKGP